MEYKYENKQEKNMRTIFFSIMIICYLVIPIDCYGFENSSFWIKSGINSGLISNPKDQYSAYSYPLGFNLGFSADTKILENLFITNSIHYKNKKAKSYVDIPTGCAPITLKYNSQYIRFSSLIGINIHNQINLLIGYDIGRLIDLNMTFIGCTVDKLKPIKPPKFDNVLCFGVEKKLNIKQQHFKIDLKYFYGLNKYKLKYVNLPENSRHNGLQLEIGYRLHLKQ